MATDAVIRAAERLRENFEEAKAEGFYKNAWYCRMAKWDIEALVTHVLGPLPEPEPEPEPEPQREVFTLTEPVVFADFAGVGGVFNPDTNEYVTGVGQKIGGVHPVAACEAREGGCVIHSPSDHHMRSWPTNFRTGGIFDIKGPHMERMCPHGIGHPDPDDLAFWLALGQDYSNHGCDGCCTPPSQPERGILT